MTLIILEITGQLFCRILLNLGLCGFDSGDAFWQEHHSCDVVPVRAYYLAMYLTSTCLFTLLSSSLGYGSVCRFPHYKATIFPFETNKYLVGRYFPTVQISCFLYYFCSLILASLDSLPEIIMAVALAK